MSSGRMDMAGVTVALRSPRRGGRTRGAVGVTEDREAGGGGEDRDGFVDLQARRSRRRAEWRDGSRRLDNESRGRGFPFPSPSYTVSELFC